VLSFQVTKVASLLIAEMDLGYPFMQAGNLVNLRLLIVGECLAKELLLEPRM
jgi:hypothetical protein